MTANTIAHPEHLFQDYAQEDWHFGVFSSQDAQHLYDHIRTDCLMRALQKAHDEQLCLTLMCVGNCDNPIWLPTHPSLVVPLKKAWHNACCKEHGFSAGSEDLASLDDYVTLMGHRHH